MDIIKSVFVGHISVALFYDRERSKYVCMHGFKSDDEKYRSFYEGKDIREMPDIKDEFVTNDYNSALAEMKARADELLDFYLSPRDCCYIRGTVN